jgi:lipopolysaccharide/colanic/teichoic acid biosynthesis glycosyltransferase
MSETAQPDYSYLIDRLADPETFDPATMPVGQDYLQSNAKTAFDIMASVGVLPITGVPTLLGAAAIKVIDHEEPVFRQQRIGYQAKPFTVYNLRTMPGVPEHTDSNGRYNDPRRSQLGRLLSLLRIDESLQLANVAKREMSVIGPRPLLGSIIDNARHIVGPKKADEWIKVRSLALPGIFDEFSNLHHSYKLSLDEEEQLHQRIDIESEYILERASFHEDLRILGNTIALLGTTAIKHIKGMTKAKK